MAQAQAQAAARCHKTEFIKAKDLAISWGNDTRYWKWVNPAPGSQVEIAELLGVWWFDVRGRIDSSKLRHKASYGAYLVFSLAESAENLNKVHARTRFVKDIAEGTDDEAFTVYLAKKPSPGEPGVFPVPRSDGWMELKLGEFYNSNGGRGQIDIRVFETSGVLKTGVSILGMELRPYN